jgi:hypothetical protein
MAGKEDPSATSRKNDQHHPAEHPVALYILASRFDLEPQALVAYLQLQGLIAKATCDLSSYRFMLEDHSFVTVLGEPPTLDLDSCVQQALSHGTFRTLPDDVARMLSARRAQSQHLGSWVEGHHQPGIRIRRDPPRRSKP